LRRLFEGDRVGDILLICWGWSELTNLVNLPPIPKNATDIENYKIWEIAGLALFTFYLEYLVLFVRIIK
jgi:hypothetical protein